MTLDQLIEELEEKREKLGREWKVTCQGNEIWGLRVVSNRSIGATVDLYTRQGG